MKGDPRDLQPTTRSHPSSGQNYTKVESPLNYMHVLYFLAIYIGSEVATHNALCW